MDFQITHLPQDLFSTKKEKEESIIFHYYQANVDSMKGKSILHKNAISLVINGEKTMHFSNQTVHIKDDEFHFLSAGNCLASVQLSKQKKFKSILIFFDTKVLTDFYLKYAKRIEALKNKKIKKEMNPYIYFKKDSFIRMYIDSLILFFESNTAISLEMRLVKWEELLLYLLEKYPDQLLSFQASQTNQELEIKKVVEVNLTNNITLEELAFLCNMSLSTFKRKFFDLYKTSPNKWILERRMEIAKNLLSHYQEKPSEVYYKVGYENHSSFAHSFKQIVGLTPKEFQLQYLNV